MITSLGGPWQARPVVHAEDKHTKASHHMQHQPELMSRVDLILGGGICYKLRGEAAQLPFPVRLQPVLAPCMFELVHRIALQTRLLMPFGVVKQLLVVNTFIPVTSHTTNTYTFGQPDYRKTEKDRLTRKVHILVHNGQGSKEFD